MVAAIADCHVRDQFNAYRSPNAVAAQGFWLFQESLITSNMSQLDRHSSGHNLALITNVNGGQLNT